MVKETFTDMLVNEKRAVMSSLLVVYEARDELLFIKGPKLERQYMDTFGEMENQVILEEMECELLRKKRQMLRILLNQRKPIDLKEIDGQLNEERKKLLEEAKGTNNLSAFANLTEDERKELQRVYHEIVRHYHPKVNLSMSEHEKNLFFRAQEAYRIGNLPELQLIYNMLTSKLFLSDTEIAVGKNINRLFDDVEIKLQAQNGYGTHERQDIDYTLAKEIFGCFVKLSNEAVLLQEIEGYMNEANAVRSEMARRQGEFPFIAAETLHDPVKTEEYRAQLRNRMVLAVSERNRLTQEISLMTEGVQ